MTQSTYQELITTSPHAAVQLLLEKDRQILLLEQQIINANRARFGPRSERLNCPDQKELFPVEELKEKPATAEPDIEVPAHTRRAQRSRRELPADTVVVQVDHPASATHCECCGEQLVQIRAEITNILTRIPAHFKLEKHSKPVMVCKCCQDKAPITTPLPAGIQLIDHSPAGVGLLAHIVISKFQDHIPLHRLETIYAREGFEIPRQRMCDWLGHVAELLHPLYKALKQELIIQSYLQADETTIKIQDGEEAKGRCHTGYLWGILGPPPLNLVYFHYADSRAGTVPQALLSGFKGVLQTDLYAGYNQVYVPETTVRAGCWAHVRRKFLEATKISPPRERGLTLELIAKLYHAELAGDVAPQERVAARQKHSAPILARLHKHLLDWSARTLPRSAVQEALQYALKQWDALSLFLMHGELKLDNNLIENQMRPVALGRKNWLFAGSHEGAMRAAIFFSIINSCRLNKVNTWLYFNDVLPKLHQGVEPQDLLPHNWKTPSSAALAA